MTDRGCPDTPDFPRVSCAVDPLRERKRGRPGMHPLSPSEAPVLRRFAPLTSQTVSPRRSPVDERIVVRNVKGRHAEDTGSIDSDCVEAHVVEESRLVRIRIDDAEHPDFWMEVTLEVER